MHFQRLDRPRLVSSAAGYVAKRRVIGNIKLVRILIAPQRKREAVVKCRPGTRPRLALSAVQ